jgi:hypothetical protein
MRRYEIVKDLARLMYEDIEPKLLSFMLKIFKGEFEEFIDVLFLLYCARCKPNDQEWLPAQGWFRELRFLKLV